MHASRAYIVTLALCAAAAASASGQGNDVRIGIVSGPMGSFAATILKAHQQSYDSITSKVPADSLQRYGVIVVDNLYRLQDLNAAAFKSYVEQGGILVIINPKTDGFSRAWSPYDVYIDEYTIEGRITNRKHPLFKGFTTDKLQDFASSNGPYVGNCSFTEPGKEWLVLAKHAKKGKNAVVMEAPYGKGRFIASCTRFDNYNAKPGATRLGDNLMEYAAGLARK